MVKGAECLPARIVERKVLFQTLAGKRVKYPNGSQKLSHAKSPHLKRESLLAEVDSLGHIGANKMVNQITAKTRHGRSWSKIDLSM
jgi:hypothetical protein